MSANKYGVKVPPLTMEPLRCYHCKRQDCTLLDSGQTYTTGRTLYVCTGCAGTLRRIA